MNVKNFLICGIIGGIADFLLGWLVYGILLHDETMPNAGKENLALIFGGCLCAGFIISFICTHSTPIVDWMNGMKVGAVIALLMHLWYGFFEAMYKDSVDVKMMAMGGVISLILGGIVGGIVAVVNGKMK
jgi:hypothetical protein